MSPRSQGRLHFLFLSLAGAAAIAIVPLRGGSPPIGLVARSIDTTIAGHAARSNTALFDGDILEVRDTGVTIVCLNSGSRVVLGRQTVASFSQEVEGVTVSLERGSVALFQPQQARGLRVKTGDLLVEPMKGGFPTLGEVAMLNGVITVRAVDGRLRLKGRGQNWEVTKGKMIKLDTRAAAKILGAAGIGVAHGAGIGGGAAVAGGVAIATGTGAAVAVSAQGPKEKNPNAVEHVRAHVPEAACEHAASPSVPAQACQD